MNKSHKSSGASNSGASNGGPASKAWWTNKRVICIALVLGAAVYILAQPKLEQWTGLDLPDLIEREQADPNPNEKSPGKKKSDRGESPGFKIDLDSLKSGKNESGFALKEIGKNSYRSPAGLVYTMGPRGEHRIDHVMLHAKDNPSRPVHGVFDAESQDQVLTLLDEAYKLIKANDQSVDTRKADRGRTEYVIDMPKRIGYVGGNKGNQQNNPATKRLQLVLQDDRVITAYPTWPPRRRR